MKTLLLAGGLMLMASGAAIGDSMAYQSLDDLRKLVPVAGSPVTVLWQTEEIPQINKDSFPPGPTDQILWAVVDYGSAEAVAAVLGDGLTDKASITAPGWFPADLSPGAELEVTRHYRVEGFLNASVMTVAAHPGLVILEKPLF